MVTRFRADHFRISKETRMQLLPRAWEPALKSVAIPIFRPKTHGYRYCFRVPDVRDPCRQQMSLCVSSVAYCVPSCSVVRHVGVYAGFGGVGLKGGAIHKVKSYVKRNFCREEGEIQQRKLKCDGGFAAAMTSAVGSPPVGYRPNVGVCLVNDKNEVWVGSRLDLPDAWQMPQGGVDEGEEPQQAAFRELREETGVTSAQLIGEVPDWLTYDFPPDVKAKITRLWGKPWTGQAQKWFLFRFTGDDSEVNLMGDGTEPAEFAQWRWMPAEDVIRMVVDFKKPVYTKAFRSLAVYVEPWSKL